MPGATFLPPTQTLLWSFAVAKSVFFMIGGSFITFTCLASTNSIFRLDCADHVLGIQDSVYNAFASYEAAWNAWYAAVREDYPRRIDP